jgi:hypothetical protein
MRHHQRSLGLCRLANCNSHEVQVHLYVFTCDESFSMIFLHMWKPGDAPEKDSTRELLTMLDGMTGFAAGDFLGKPITAEVRADRTFSQFFCVFGLPRLSKFCGIFTKTFDNLGIHVEVVSRENHKAVRNGRFHRYLNRVQQINTADTGSFFQWKQGVTFALYGWNAGPIDGTIIPRPFGAIDERRQQNLDLKNDSITERTFAAGDLIIVRKQVKSNADRRGIPGKIVVKSRGPYQVLEQANPGSYWIQKLPFLDGLGNMGQGVKESTARMQWPEWNASPSLVIHKQPDGADTRMASMRHLLVNNPVQKWFGAIDSGAYQPAATTEAHAFLKVEGMWSDPIGESKDEEEAAAPTMPSAEEPPATRTRPPTRSRVLHQLYQTIYKSRNVLCSLIQTWYLVQVNLNKTDPVLSAKRLGHYWVHWMIRHHVDCQSKQQKDLGITGYNPPPCGLPIQTDPRVPVLARNSRAYHRSTPALWENSTCLAKPTRGSTEAC